MITADQAQALAAMQRRELHEQYWRRHRAETRAWAMFTALLIVGGVAGFVALAAHVGAF